MVRRVSVLVAALVAPIACSAPAAPPKLPTSARDVDPDGPHRAAVVAQVKPFLDAEIVRGLVVGLYDAGKREIYGFGVGPGGAPPTGSTLFEIGSVTKIYTSLLLADAVQRREVSLDTAVSELLPPGVTVPTKDKVSITLGHLALHLSGLPRIPASLLAPRPDPYAGYGEDALYRDLITTQLEATPGTRGQYSNYGVGLLGFALGRKIGGGYPQALTERVLRPLGLTDTHLGFPAGAPRAEGTNEDLAPVPPWTWDALAGAGALVSTARDQLALIDAELDAAAGGKLPLRGPMRLTQEILLDQPSGTAGLGWIIDRDGRYWHNGGTGGFRAFVGFDPKTRRGVVILAATATTLVDRLAPILYDVLAGSASPPLVFASADQLARYAGTYDLLGTQVAVTVVGTRLYMKGPDEPPVRLLPVSPTKFFIEPLQSIVTFEAEGDAIARLAIDVNGQTIKATRVGAP